MSSSVASSQWSGTSHRALRCSPSWILRQLCMRSAKDARQQGVAITTRQPCGRDKHPETSVSLYTIPKSVPRGAHNPLREKAAALCDFILVRSSQAVFLRHQEEQMSFSTFAVQLFSGKGQGDDTLRRSAAGTTWGLQRSPFKLVYGRPFASGLDHHRKFSLPVKLQTMSDQIPLEEGGRRGPSKGSLLSTLESTIVV